MIGVGVDPYGRPMSFWGFLFALVLTVLSGCAAMAGLMSGRIWLMILGTGAMLYFGIGTLGYLLGLLV